MIWSHIGPWTWCRIVRCGRRYQTGENHGTPFHTSTRASERPIRPASSATAVRGNTVYRLPRRITS